MTTQLIAAPTRFQLALRVADLPRSIRFYRLLLKCEPIEGEQGMVRFETDQPPLVLTLTEGDARRPESTLNHLGFRLPDQVSLVDLQRRLEEGGIATQRQEGVECCYARQTKFWVTDPDRHLWELYIFHEDIDHSGFDDPAQNHPWKAKAEPVVWTHKLTDPIPATIDFPVASFDEVHLEGSFNARMETTVKSRFLAEIYRVLRPGGNVAIHGMAGDRPFPGEPMFPGLASFVKYVPVHSELSADLHQVGFVNIFLEKFDSICLSIPGMELREIRVLGTRPDEIDKEGAVDVLYRGPCAEVTNDEGICFRRGERVAVNARTCASLRQGPVAEQFVFLPSK